MRISVLETDPGFAPNSETGHKHVYMDGMYLDNCVTADTRLGWALVFNPEWLRDPYRTKDQYVDLIGKVEIYDDRVPD